jgi:hypothetical protein
MKDRNTDPATVVPDPPEVAAVQRRRISGGAAAALVASGLIVGVVVTGLNIAGAQTPTPNTPSLPKVEKHEFKHHGGGFGMGGIHGEFTTRAPGGGYQTLASQIGEVTSVSASSVTVKSEDGYSRTYVVDDNTLVNAGNNGIADVKKGDTVRITALVSGGKARAVDLMDITKTGALRGRWLPPPRLPGSSG